MSLIQFFPPTELEIDDITGSDQFPDDLKVYAESWDDYHCQRRNWGGFGCCHWLFWSRNHEFEVPIFDLPQAWVMEKIKSILIDVEGRGDFLVQFWRAIDVEEVGTKQKILRSRNQLFGLNATDIALFAYASMSRFHESDATSEQQHSGLLNRVFRSQQAECTTEPRAYPIPPRAAAVDCNITASLAFPLFELWGLCGGIMEIVTNSDRPTNELYEIFRNIVSKYTRVCGDCIHLYERTEKKEEALEEIKKSLEEIRRIHDIPLARTWIPCRMCDALMCLHRVIKTQVSSHIRHLSTWGRVKKGQGVVGKAFLSNKLEFGEDVPGFRTDILTALRCGLAASFAVPLSSSLNEEDDIYVVEFFLPPKYVEFRDWRSTAFPLLSTMRQHLKSVSIDEIGKNLSIDDHLEENGGELVGPDSPSQGKENLPIDGNFVENGGKTVQVDSLNQGKEYLPLVENGGKTVRLNLPNQEKEEGATAHAENNNESDTKQANMTVASSLRKVQHRKAGIPISLEFLQQHFGMTLEDAAESIGVGRSTLKRACREYNIAWWPLRKRKTKDNRSIPKKSVQCAAVKKQIGETSEAPISNSSGFLNCKIDDNFVENGGETVRRRLASPNQEKEEGATLHAENNNESNTKKTNRTVSSSLKTVQNRKAGIPIPLELLQQHFGMKLEDAAESIGVGRSTLKRACREYNIAWWPSRKRKNKDNRSILKKTLQCAAVEKQIGKTSEAPIFNPFGKQHTETNISTELREQDISSVTIKAKFGAEDFIKFKLPITSGMREFQHQIEKRLHWKDKTYSIRYQDDDNDSILVKIDEDLQEYICSSRAMGRNIVTVSLQPITNFPN